MEGVLVDDCRALSVCGASRAAIYDESRFPTGYCRLRDFLLTRVLRSRELIAAFYRAIVLPPSGHPPRAPQARTSRFSGFGAETHALAAPCAGGEASDVESRPAAPCAGGEASDVEWRLAAVAAA